MIRVLDWWGLCQVADRKDPANRRVTVAGVPARVRPSRGTDVGFYVQHDQDDTDHPWELRTPRELTLLALLVDAGAVTIDDPETHPLRQEPRT